MVLSLAGLFMAAFSLGGSWLVGVRNRPNLNEEILVPDWPITSHVTLITSSDWLFTSVGRLLVWVFVCEALPTINNGTHE